MPCDSVRSLVRFRIKFEVRLSCGFDVIEAVDLAKDQQPEGLQLWTFASNVGAQRFYERHGFEAVERTDGSDNEEGAPDIRYVWSGVTRGRG